MKIANKGLLVLGMGAALIAAPFFIAASATNAQAADAPGIAPPPPSLAMSGAIPVTTPPTASAAGADLTKSAVTDVSKDLSGAEDRAEDSAKAIVKKLDSADTATLEDLNNARQAIARLTAMTDVERHLAELQKAREERTGSHSLSSAIPASALAPPLPGGPINSPMPLAAQAMPVQEMPRPITPSFSSTEISRITGIDGKYAAVLKGSGDSRTVRVGDKVASGGTVTFISPTTVQIEENGSTRTLHVKNADVVYSAMR